MRSGCVPIFRLVSVPVQRLTAQALIVHVPGASPGDAEDDGVQLQRQGHTHLTPCGLLARTGVPARSPLFNGTDICGPEWQRVEDTAQTFVAVHQPVALPIPRDEEDGRVAWGAAPGAVDPLVLTLTRQGVLTAVDAQGDVAWQVGGGREGMFSQKSLRCEPMLQ